MAIQSSVSRVTFVHKGQINISSPFKQGRETQETTKKPGSKRKCTMNSRSGGHSNQGCAVDDSSVITRGELKEKLLLKCTKHIKSKPKLDRMSCAPDMMSTDAEKGAADGKKTQEPRQAPQGRMSLSLCSRSAPGRLAQAGSDAYTRQTPSQPRRPHHLRGRTTAGRKQASFTYRSVESIQTAGKVQAYLRYIEGPGSYHSNGTNITIKRVKLLGVPVHVRVILMLY